MIDLILKHKIKASFHLEDSLKSYCFRCGSRKIGGSSLSAVIYDKPFVVSLSKGELNCW
jgi:hypothetical protein